MAPEAPETHVHESETSEVNVNETEEKKREDFLKKLKNYNDSPDGNPDTRNEIIASLNDSVLNSLMSMDEKAKSDLKESIQLIFDAHREKDVTRSLRHLFASNGSSRANHAARQALEENL